ncbi:MAG: hypothetical protein J6I96_02715 [Oscillospiraceae bacterium]|nr:hypothetical protein [Oscillospiraceae bacterium]
MRDMTIKSIRSETLTRMKSCWPEMSFIIVLAAGIVFFFYAALVFMGQVLGVHDSFYAIPSLSLAEPAYIAGVLGLYTVLYLGSVPLSYGIRWFYWNLSGGAVMPLSSLFACYDSWHTIQRCIIVRLMTDLRRITRFIVLGTFGYAVFFICARVGTGHERLIESIETFTVFVLLVIYYVSTMDLFFVPYIFADNPDLDAGEIINRSIRATKYRYNFSVKLFFSCIPWSLSAVLVFPMMFVLPLVNIIHAVYLRRIMDDMNEKKDTDTRTA